MRLGRGDEVCYNAAAMRFFSRSLWYADGLAFECVRCGRCCAGPDEGYVWTTAAEIETLAEHLAMSIQAVRDRYVRRVGARHSLVENPENKDCIFLDYDSDGLSRCEIYTVRPTQCRTWPFWPGNLTSPRDWALAGVRCRGTNRGPKHDLDEIQAKRNRTRS